MSLRMTGLCLTFVTVISVICFSDARLSGASPSSLVAGPDLILINGKIWTENPNQPQAEAVAVTGDRIVAVGQSAEIERLADSHTERIDLRGRRMLPGFNDAHVHFYAGGDSLTSVQLQDVHNEAEFRDKISAFVKTTPPGTWILNGNWEHESWSPARMPNHEVIDGVTSKHPVFVSRSDGHSALANALAMKLAGVDKNTRDVPGGVIVRDTNGEPTGIFKDAAQALVAGVIPAPSETRIRDAILAAQRYALKNGVTSVQDMGGSAALSTMRTYQTLEREKKLNVRVSSHLPLRAWKRLSDAGIMAGFGSSLLKTGSLKGFADGSLGSTTAWLLKPYADDASTAGIPSDELSHEEEMYRNIVDSDKAGLQVAIHAIGDRANRSILNLYQRAGQANGVRDRRFRIEHAQYLDPADVKRFAQLNIVASVQPYQCIDDGRWAFKRVGTDRVKNMYVFRSLLDAGTKLTFGSDWPVVPMSPLLGIYAAVTRRTLDGKHPDGWTPEQKVTIAEAIHAYTIGAAYAAFEEDEKGSVERGKLADFVVLSEDILHIDPVAIQSIQVDMTIAGGHIAYRRRQ